MTALLFILFWVVLGVGLVVIAASGGIRGARSTVLQRQTRGARRTYGVIFVLAYIGLGVAIPAIVIADDRDDDVDVQTGTMLTAAQESGREIFGLRCQQCHTLKGANAVGEVGPNLDQLRPPAALVLSAINQGRVRGVGTMPAELVQGKDANDVASFVAAVAGRN